MANKANPLSIRLTDDQVRILKDEARRQSLELNKDVSYSDLIRSSVENYLGTLHIMESDGQHSIECEQYDMENKERFSALFKDPDELLNGLGIITNHPICVEMRRIIEHEIKNSLAYKILDLDVLEIDALPRYERHPSIPIFCIARRGAVPECIIEGEELLAPTFDIAASASIKFNEIFAKRFYIIDRAILNSAKSLVRELEFNIFTLLESANKKFEKSYATIDFSQIDSMIEQLVTYSACRAYHIIVHPSMLWHLNCYSQIYDGNWNFDRKNGPLHYKNLEIIENEHLANNKILITSSPQYTGILVRKLEAMAYVSPEITRLQVNLLGAIHIGLVANEGFARTIIIEDLK